MKKLKFYQKSCFSVALALGLSTQVFGQSNCTGVSCEVSDLIVENGSIWTVSEKYPLDPNEELGIIGEMVETIKLDNKTIQILTVINEAASLSFLVKSDGKYYTQKRDIRGIRYDYNTGALSIPPISESWSLFWYKVESQVPVSTSPTYFPDAIGLYKLVINTPANLRTEATSNTITYMYHVTQLPNPTGLFNAEKESNQVSIYPNPATDHFFINETGDFDYKIENVNSTVVGSGKGNNVAKVDLAGLTPGIYFVHIDTETKQAVKRIVVR